MIKPNLVLGLILWTGIAMAAPVEPTWESLAANYQVPQWFVDGKIGIWMHWGIPSAADENRPNDGSHYARRMYATVPEDYSGKLNMSQTLTKWHTERYGHPSEFGYEDLIPLFKAEKWDPDSLVKFLKDNGARIIMPVACHHDNFDMYDSFHPWNSVKMGPKRDTLKEWKEAATKHGLKFGVSTHLYWSPRFLMAARKYQTPGTPEWDFFNMDYSPMGYASQDSWNEHWYARCWEIIEKYDPDMFNNDAPYPKIGPGKGLGVKLFTDFINRDLKENNGKQTVVLSFKDPSVDRSAFTYNLERGGAGELKPEPWMWATDLSGGWFYRRTAVNKMSIPVMVANAVDAISKNGIVMLNVALRGDGTLPEKQAAYLTAFGDFLKINGEGIYGIRPWKSFGEGPLKVKDGRQGENHRDFSQEDIRFTIKDGDLYAFVLAPPTEDIVIKTLAQGGLYLGDIGTINLLGSTETLTWERSTEALTIQLPKTLPDQPVIGFRITSASTQQKPARYPKFSWDIVPVAFHFGKNDSLMTETEARFVASRSNFICLEKGHAAKQFGNTETGIEKEAQQLKKLNPDMKVIFYWNTFLDYPMFQAHEVYQNHPGWWLKTLGGKLDKKKDRIKRYDLSNPEVRNWWTDVVLKAVVEGSCDGVFMDAFPQITNKRNIALWGQEKFDAIQQGLKDIIKETRQKIGEDKLIVYNGIRSTPSWQAGYDFPDYTDAAMIEHFGEFQSTSKECMLKDIQEMEKACKNGKIVVFKGWPGFTFTDREAMRKPLDEKREIAKKNFLFPLAAFLVGAQENSYFIYNWGYRIDNGCLEWYPEFDKPLGEPLGDMVRDGWILSRQFKHASVWVNIETRKADIQWHKSADKKSHQQVKATRATKRPKYLETGGERKLEILYKKTTNQDLFLDLYYPTGNRAEKCPVIVYTHGGGWAAGSRHKVANGAFGSVFQQLVKEGFAVAPVTYRLAKKDSNVAMRDCVIDSKDAIRFLAKNGESLGIDPMRVYVMGDSAGGHIAQMLLLSSPESLPGDPALAGISYRMVAGVSWYGPCDFEKTDLFNHDDRPDFRDRFGPRIMGSDSGPEDKLTRYREMSPINYLAQTSPPLLMIQGDKDTTIPVKHAYYMQEKAKALQAPVEIMIIKNSGHNWRKVGADIEPSWAVINERTVQFFVDHL